VSTTEELTLNSYQLLAKQTATTNSKSLEYLVLGLNGEAGEVADQAKRVLRDDDGVLTISRKDRILGEMGDCLWYLASLATFLETDLNDIARQNLEKLLSRKNRSQLLGEGENR